MSTPFKQAPPVLGNQYDDDRVLVAYLAERLPEDILADIEPRLRRMGELAGGDLYRLFLADRENEPVLTSWDAWGERVDHIEVSPLWKRAAELATTEGLIATAYERKHGALSRVHQFALAYLFLPVTDVYGCPLAMTDGASRALLDSGNQALVERALPRLTSRDPRVAWTSGQWMTELTGGSDVGRSETIARRQPDGTYRLYGRKWFTSAITADMALTLARPEGNPEGGHGLAMFYVELRDANGRLDHIEVNRLKDKLGTRKVPTAELALDGVRATLVAGTTDGTRMITPMLNITRTWNAVTAVALMRRGLALSRAYSRQRFAFGAKLADKPLHVETLATLQAEQEAAFHLTFATVELLGKQDTGVLSEREDRLLRLLTPLAKLTTGKQAVAVLSEVVESFGGAGYVEDTGIPTLLRDAQVLPIWEGTTNVLSLDVLRALAKSGGLEELVGEVSAPDLRDTALIEANRVAELALQDVRRFLEETRDRDVLEASARGVALTLGRAYALSRLTRHAERRLVRGDVRPRAAAIRFAREGVDRLAAVDLTDARLLANDT